MTRILYRYLGFDLTVPFFSWLGGLALMLLGNFLFLLLKAAQGRPLPWELTVRYLAFRVPFAIMMALPMAFLFAAALSINRFSRDGELVAMRMGGMSPRKILLPYMIAGSVCSCMAVVIYDRVMPWANHISDNAVRGIFLQQADIRPTEDFFVKVPGGHYIFYARDVDLESDVLHDVVLCKLFDTEFPEFTVAQSAVLRDNVWTLNQGRKYKFDKNGFILSSGTAQVITIDLKEIIEAFWEDQRTPEEQSIVELRERIQFLHQSGQRASVEITELHSKFSIPFACIAFALVVGPLAMRFHGGSFTGMLLAAGTLFVYYIILTWGKILGHGGNMNPALGAWIQNIVFVILGVVLVIKAR